LAEKTPDKDDDLMAEFAEFLEAKRAKEQEANEAEDFDVEIWDEKGRGVRTRRSHAKPFLQSLGIDVDSPSADGTSDDGDEGKGPKKPRKTPPKQSTSTVRKYFTGSSK
jgi:hypothetical protein